MKVQFGLNIKAEISKAEAKKNDTRFNILSALIVGSAVVISL